MKASVALRLSRVSNLPTVWTNTLAGIALAGGEIVAPRTLLLLAAFSLLYSAGMVLNDAFDHRIDKTERPERPIPSGDLGAGMAFAAGFALMGGALLLLLWMGIGAPDGSGWRAPAAGLALTALVVLYDWRHKGVAWSPYLMGACRALVYLTAGLAFVPLPPTALWLGAAALFAYVAGLTAIAKGEARRKSQEGRLRASWPLALLSLPLLYGPSTIEGAGGALLYAAFLLWTAFALWHVAPEGLIRGGLIRGGALLSGRLEVGRAVGYLIAGVPLFDALLIAGTGSEALAWLAAAAWPLTLALQRRVPGT